MDLLTLDFMKRFWSAPEVAVNVVIFMNLVGALLLGLIVGYERSYHGRAAGMRTYGLVCTASAGLVVLCGYPAFWYGGGVSSGFGSDSLDIKPGIGAVALCRNHGTIQPVTGIAIIMSAVVEHSDGTE